LVGVHIAGHDEVAWWPGYSGAGVSLAEISERADADDHVASDCCGSVADDLAMIVDRENGPSDQENIGHGLA
jgi:hypothetical protein